MAQNIGHLICIVTAACLTVTTVKNRFVEGLTWDNVSTRYGLLLTKTAMIIDAKFGPLCYFCMILMIYNFALIVNRRRYLISEVTTTLPVQVYFAYFIM